MGNGFMYWMGSNIIINQWVSNLTPKRLIIYLAIFAVGIYVVCYVVEALQGFDPNYRPSKLSAEPATGNIIKGGPEIFDPTKKTPTAVPAP